MNVNFVLPAVNLNGGTRVIARYAEMLERNGHEVIVTVLADPPVPLKMRLRVLLKERRWFTYSSSRSHFDNSPVELIFLKEFGDLRDRDVPDADIVIATFWPTARQVMNLAPSKGTKVFFAQGFEVAPGEQNPQLDEAWRLPLQKIVVSEELKTLARTKFGDNNAILVSNGVDHSHFCAQRRTKNRRPTLGFIYSSGALKGYAEVREITKRILLGFPDARIVCFGAEKLAREMSGNPNLKYHVQPTQSSIPSLYAQCDAWLCASQSEGFCLPILEAMACRTPVISTRVGCSEMLIKHGSNGYLCDIGDVDALTRHCKMVLDMENDDWVSMSDNAYAASLGYSLDHSELRFEQALMKILDQSKSSRD